MRIPTFIRRVAILFAVCGSAHAQSTSFDGLDHFIRPSPATPADEIRVAYSNRCGGLNSDNRAAEIERIDSRITVTLYVLEANQETCTATSQPPVEITTSIDKLPAGDYTITRILRARTPSENTYRTVDTREEKLVVGPLENIFAISPAEPLALEPLTALVPIDGVCEQLAPIEIDDDALVVTVRRVRFGSTCATERKPVGVTMAALPAGRHRIVLDYRNEFGVVTQSYERTIVVAGVPDADAVTNTVDYSGLWTFPGRAAGLYLVHAVGEKNLQGTYRDLLQGRLLGRVTNGPDGSNFALEANATGFGGRLIPPGCEEPCIDVPLMTVEFEKNDPNSGRIYIYPRGVFEVVPLRIERFRWKRPSVAAGQ